MKPQCRICLDEDGELFSPCLCRGSVKYVHRECLNTWLAAAQDPLRCTICRAPYLRRSLKYYMQDCCTTIQYNGLVIFACNMGAAITVGVPISFVHLHLHSYNTQMVWIGIVHCILIFIELLYGLSIALKHRLHCIKLICPEAIMFLFLSGFVAFPIADNFNVRDEFTIISYATILLMFNFYTAALFKGITKQLAIPARNFILPYPPQTHPDCIEEHKEII